MEKSFWKSKWDANQIGFHRTSVSPLLLNCWDQFATDKGTVFVPLCGKSVDMLYFVEKGHQVIGVELIEKAILEFQTENNLTLQREVEGSFIVYSNEKIKLYCGDLFDLEQKQLSGVRYIYDRASMVALPLDLRLRYCEFLNSVLGNADCFLEVMSFDNKKLGPPFSVGEAFVRDNLNKSFEVNVVEKNLFPATESVIHNSIPYINYVYFLKSRSF